MYEVREVNGKLYYEEKDPSGDLYGELVRDDRCWLATLKKLGGEVIGEICLRYQSGRTNRGKYLEVAH